MIFLSKAKWNFSLPVPLAKNYDSLIDEVSNLNSMGQIYCKNCGALIFDDSLITDCPECGLSFSNSKEHGKKV